MSASDRKEASKRLGLAIRNRYEKLVTAVGEDAIVIATTDLAQVMYENVEFVIWALLKQGGLNPPLPERFNKISAQGPRPAANSDLPTLPPELTGDQSTADLPCTCPPLEAGIIGRDRHMAACPKYEG